MKDLLYKIMLCLCAVAIVTSSPVQVVALTKERELFFNSNNISMYDDECSSDSSAGLLLLAGDDTMEKIINFFMRKDVKLPQIAGLLGNMQQESGLKPNIEQGGKIVDENYQPKNGVGFGLVQWTFTSRQAPLVELAKQNGVPVTDLSLQLEYIWQELSGPYAPILAQAKATTDPVKAAIIFHDGYEVSNDTDEEVRRVRGGFAQEVFDKYRAADPLAGQAAEDELNRPPNSAGTPTAEQVVNKKDKDSNCSNTSFDGGNFDETLKAYAWPDYRGNILDRKPAYIDAVNEVMEQGLYSGDCRGACGVDCGVFVTLLVRNSGWDPQYNYNGGGGNTTFQYKWTSENWEDLGDASTIDPATLQKGDVANNNTTHTFIYVGEVDGFDSNIASSSWGERAPMADTAQSPTQSGYHWFRKKGTPRNIEKSGGADDTKDSKPTAVDV